MKNKGKDFPSKPVQQLRPMLDERCKLSYTVGVNMRFGAARRAYLVDWLRYGRDIGEERQITVNRSHCRILKHDADLRVLLKKGILVRQRLNNGPSSRFNKRPGAFSTILQLA